MTKFNVGDKVRILNGGKLVENGNYSITTGKEYEVISFHEKSELEVEHIKVAGNFSNPFTICDWEYKYIELVETKQTKNQRITALENEVAELRPLKQEVAELKLIVHELRGHRDIDLSSLSEPSTTNTVEDVIEFEGKQYRKVDREAREGDVVIFSKSDSNHIFSDIPYEVKKGSTGSLNVNLFSLYNSLVERTPKVTTVYELIKTKPLTPNQQRAAIIEKAKKFVEKVSSRQSSWAVNEIGNETYQQKCTVNEFIINNEKRTIVVLVKGEDSGKIFEKGIAKCNPSDVFNEHIGKAIALGRALKLDVSEFEQAVQPNRRTDGMVIEYRGITRVIATPRVLGETCDFDSEFARYGTIINDTNTIYGGVE